VNVLTHYMRFTDGMRVTWTTLGGTNGKLWPERVKKPSAGWQSKADDHKRNWVRGERAAAPGLQQFFY